MNKEVTVIVMTYNQAQYISKALDSILEQETSFDFDILIHDDCSNDETSDLINKYQAKYPNKIRTIIEKERCFPKEGFNMMIYNHVVPLIDSKFVAYCDGDDYWCDSHKLQKQYDFMHKHKDYSMCFHSALQLKNNNDTSSKWFIGPDEDVDLSFVISDKPGIRIATSSIFLKSEVFRDFSEWRKQYPVEDIPMYITAALSGKIRRLSDVMCVYRYLSSGSWSSNTKSNVEKTISHLEQMKKALSQFDESTNNQFHELVKMQLQEYDFRIAFNKKDYKTIFLKDNKRFIKRMSRKDRFSLKLQYKCPRLYNLFHRKSNHL